MQDDDLTTLGEVWCGLTSFLIHVEDKVFLWIGRLQISGF